MSLPLSMLIVPTIVLLKYTVAVAAIISDSEAPIAKPGCESHCGEVKIPYPFGIGGSGSCYFDEWYKIDCLNSTRNVTPLLTRASLEVLEISTEKGTLKVKSPIKFKKCPGKNEGEALNLTGSPFVFSQRWNIFIAASCGKLVSMISEMTARVACMSFCDKNTTDSSCSGMNCCQTNIPSNLMAYTIDFGNLNRGDLCKNYAFLVDQKWFQSRRYEDVAREMDSVPVVLEWNLLYNNLSIKEFGKLIDHEMDLIPHRRPVNVSTPYCITENTTPSVFNQTRIRCLCHEGFQGNPYINGCRDINECENDHDHHICKDALCKNLVGTYECYKKAGRNPTMKRLLLGVSVGSGLVSLLFGAWFLRKVMKKRRKLRRKQKYFKRNGGLLLQNQLCNSSGVVNVETVKLFNSKELEKATDRFNADRILGQGGQGTVYKGMLADGRIVAVKKSKIADDSQLVQFINEVVILSQINHRNVVKLLGCCLETEVPLLVYEFIPNGTLSHYIHGQNEEFPLTWEMRLRIAVEISGALSYLHYAASLPIYHRDIKSTNILLDDKYRAKIADFGTSRSVPVDQTHLTTLVHGTLGYLDPEYFQSSQFTDKSDVYSFGVVLVELLTGQRAISKKRSEEAVRSLATYFITSMQQSSLFDILDAHVLKGRKEDIMVVANLAKRCLNLNGRKRPTMKEVTVELEGIQMLKNTTKTTTVATDPNINAVNPQNYEEVEYVRTQSIEPWDDVVSTSTGSALDTCLVASSSQQLPLLPFKSW
ncbi:hypothetical protein FNV43_RR14741 [Rhamnella rubrinervis]|uniref:Protein kinase domain-containing protein n=1 Tax=Rhamnella rubrinervis TaxID=2594499 RepID=A0A8K0H3W6_9ROSA|nr:hypothetical protein FNV43_RR14741 [Rhamnella rubrinervis]